MDRIRASTSRSNVAPLLLDRAAPWLDPPRSLVALVMQLLEKDPANRFQKAHVLAEALAAVASGPLPTLTPPGIQVTSESAPVSQGAARLLHQSRHSLSSFILGRAIAAAAPA